MASPRSAAARSVTTTGLTLPSSPKNGIGSGRAAATSARKRPARSDPVNVAARIRGSRSMASPASSPSTSWSVPSGSPAATSAADAASATRRDSSGWPGCAFTTTGQPTASADAVSPPATENANGKFDAAKFRTGPTGTR